MLEHAWDRNNCGIRSLNVNVHFIHESFIFWFSLKDLLHYYSVTL